MKFSDLDVALQNQLLGLDDSAYVKQLYLRVLGRAVDPDGHKSYLEKLGAGLPREEVYAALANSEEGLRYASRRAGLRQSPPTVHHQPVPATALQATTVRTTPAVLVIEHVNDLLALNGANFVATVYQVLLNREVDPDGARTYLNLLRAGWTKLHVVTALANSDEARRVNRALPGLKQALISHAKAQRRSWGGWYDRNVLGMESDLAADRERRALVFRLVLGDGV